MRSKINSELDSYRALLKHYDIAENNKKTMKQKGNVMDRRIRLKCVNPHIICCLCKGYMINATTITECLHTFCKSCIVKWLEENVTCPKCQIVIHQSHPLNYISHDRTMQDIVYKLVPRLQENEINREEVFYKKRGLPLPKATPNTSDEKENASRDQSATACTTEQDYHRSDEQVNIFLDCSDDQMKSVIRKYIRCSSQITITHIKKFISKKLYGTLDRFREIDVLCNDELLGKDHTLKFICVTRWRSKDVPLQLVYRSRLDV